MPTFMVQASYTNIAWNKLVQRPENRMEALKPVVEKLGGQVLAWYYTFGDYDVLVLFDVPSNVNAAAFSMAINRGERRGEGLQDHHPHDARRGLRRPAPGAGSRIPPAWWVIRQAIPGGRRGASGRWST
jgi:uncharacterized protein with GYD domain